ncbi:unnamed protein product [Vitrella brassicaformis CCMP3155]|uniref:Rieske domain-containing protein n=2 Tax=Vitrella brassicaformis TaxID=1169539 RepID=A0A0G4FAM8_VITBC|nr:unnamed protein product [Vitrella brassicaformis CCMP3155]|mmetsp:Transcript_45401/g.112781  ORF Transcript_45401/g.112781 Transcript_45401/m.112781 type:complete len:533 (+) Transcript_45401:124-1722(+)|eukprot:CEM09956.1 unnamed protein product [Vitrella brassicaformis CCMP3155]
MRLCLAVVLSCILCARLRALQPHGRLFPSPSPSKTGGGLLKGMRHRYGVSGPLDASASASVASSVVDVGVPTGGIQLHEVVDVPDSGRAAPSFDWMAHWYPIAPVSCTDKERPFSFTLLNQPLVIWWDEPKQEWRCALDRCPHRMAPLSEGRIVEGNVECPYHGWRFEGSTGGCTAIPQAQPDTPLPIGTRACATIFPCQEQQGLVWVRPTPDTQQQHGGGAEAGWPAMLTSETVDSEQPNAVTFDSFRDVPYDYATLFENLIDQSHVPITHHGSASSRKKAKHLPLRMTRPASERGFEGVYEDSEERVETVFRAPMYQHHNATRKGYSLTALHYCVPMEPGRARIIGRITVKFDNGGPVVGLLRRVPLWLVHLFALRSLDDDNIFLHVQDRRIAAAGGPGKLPQNYYLPTATDLYVAQFRTWVKKWGSNGPWGFEPLEGLTKLTPRSELLNHVDSHIIHCTQCLKALKTMNSLKGYLRVGVLLGIIGASRLAGKMAWYSGGGMVACAMAMAAISAIENALKYGPEIPMRNK